MSIYHENKSTYSRLMGGDGTALSDASGALEVHSGSKSHMTSELLAMHHVDFSRNGNGHKCHRPWCF